MNSIIINGFYSDLAKQIVSSAPFEQVFYIGEPSLNILNSQKVKCYNCYDFNCNIFPTDLYDSEPLDQKTIYEYIDCETIVLKMYERLDFWFTTTYDQRKQNYLINLRYWLHIINKFNVICYLGSNFPHEIYDYIIYSIIKKRNGKTFFFSQIFGLNRFLLESDFYLYPRFKKILNSKMNMAINSDVTNYLESLRKPAKEVKKPFYVEIFENRGTVKNQHLLIKRYNKLYAENADYTKKYVYFALHYQPEMTTCPIAGAFVNQYLILEMLDYYLPDNIFLYVKEHPQQTTVCRTEAFYAKYSSFNRIKFIHTTENSIDLIDNSIAVATCTGTVGTESLCRGKPVLMFGNYFYQFAPGCFPIKTNQDLIDALNTIQLGYTISFKDIQLFFQKFYDYSFKGYIDPILRNRIDIDENTNTNSIINIIQKEIFDKLNTIKKEGLHVK